MYVKSILIRKRTLGLVALAIMGLGLVCLGCYNDKVNKWMRQLVGIEEEKNVTAQTGNSGGLSIELTEQQPENNNKPSAFFVEYRMQREKMRGQRVEFLREIINNPESSAETRQKAQDQILLISNDINKEMEVENLIRAKGFKDCVVFLQSQSVTVIVRAENISSDEAARIADIVSRGTGVPLQNVIIIPKS